MSATLLPLSVIIICKNSERYLEQVLAPWQNLAKEIIVVDSGSTDRTLEIANQYNAKIFITATWPGFGPQKNYALSLATEAWILALDSDEVASEALCASVKEAVLLNEPAGYLLDRISSFCGQEMKHSGWYPDWILRLFPRTHGEFTNVMCHEKIVLDPGLPIHKLTGPLWHYTITNLETMLNKVNHYSTANAADYYAAGRRSSFTKAVLRSCWTFVRTYFLKRGFLDGKYGFILAVANAEGVYYKYMKLILLHQQAKQAGR